MTVENDDQTTADEKTTSRFPRKPMFWSAALAAAILLAWWVYQRSIHVYTDDARIATDLVVISSKVSGRIEALSVGEGSPLAVGDRIAQLDARENRLRVEELEAQLKATEASIAQSRAQHTMVERQTAGALQAAQSALEAAQANLASADSDLQLKEAEWARSRSLREKGILSQQGWEQARSAFQVAQQSQNRARAQVASAQAKLVEANASRDELDVLQQEQARLQHERNRVAALLEREQVALEERRIVSPIDGVVDQTFVNSGEYVMPGQRLALVHNPDAVWVKANIKETEIRHLALNQPVRVEVDAYPGEIFDGKVVRIGYAATSQFALLPSTNPSGNFTKITQRLPVKIAVEQSERKLKPGMMVEIAIDIR